MMPVQTVQSRWLTRTTVTATDSGGIQVWGPMPAGALSGRAVDGPGRRSGRYGQHPSPGGQSPGTVTDGGGRGGGGESPAAAAVGGPGPEQATGCVPNSEATGRCGRGSEPPRPSGQGRRRRTAAYNELIRL
jgi:hypothetical protein